MTSILDIPADVLRQMPTSYRMWKLLQMTCIVLSNRLGDYHEARGIILIREGIFVNYDSFIRSVRLVCSSGGWFGIPLGMATANADPIMSWHTGFQRMNICENGCIVGYIARIIDNEPHKRTTFITIGFQRYYISGTWARFIYDELPALTLDISITQRFTSRLLESV